MPYTSPIAVYDPSDAWEDEVNALDLAFENYASCKGLSSGVWSGFLEFTFPAPLTGYGRVIVGTPSGLGDVGVEQYDGEDWRVTEGSPFVFGIWPTAVNMAVSNAIRLRIYARQISGGAADVYLSGVAIWTACGGILAPICEIFHSVGDFFSNLADAISGVFVVGDYLASPFRSLGGTFHDLGDTCCQASATLQEILDLLEGGITWDEISAMILGHWPNLAPLITDPLGYITDIISDLIPDIPDWLSDPLSWLIDTLKERFPSLYYLVVDPAGQMLYLLAQLFDLTPYEARTPEFLVKALFERYFPELYLIWRDPIRWLVDTLLTLKREIVEPIADKLQDLGEHLLRLMWEGEW